MKVEEKKVVTFDYTLSDDGGQVIDSSDGGEPLVYIHGTGFIVPGLEKAMAGRSMGEQFSVTVSAAEGYGDYDEKQIQEVPMSMFKKMKDMVVGMQFYAGTENNMRIVTVTKIEGDKVTIDANHPLAGKTLNFKIEVKEIREATKEELEHGHVHGAGGCGH